MSADPPVPTPRLWLEERGRRCPAPVIALGRAVFAHPPGIVVAVLSDDPAAHVDIPAWCRLRGATFLGERAAPDGRGGHAFVVRLPEAAAGPSNTGPSASATGSEAR